MCIPMRLTRMRDMMGQPRTKGSKLLSEMISIAAWFKREGVWWDCIGSQCTAREAERAFINAAAMFLAVLAAVAVADVSLISLASVPIRY